MNKLIITRSSTENNDTTPDKVPNNAVVSKLYVEIEYDRYNNVFYTGTFNIKRLIQNGFKTIRSISTGHRCSVIEFISGNNPQNGYISFDNFGFYLRGSYRYHLLSNKPLDVKVNKTNIPEHVEQIISNVSYYLKAVRVHKDDPFLGGDYPNITNPYGITINNPVQNPPPKAPVI